MNTTTTDPDLIRYKAIRAYVEGQGDERSRRAMVWAIKSAARRGWDSSKPGFGVRDV